VTGRAAGLVAGLALLGAACGGTAGDDGAVVDSAGRSATSGEQTPDNPLAFRSTTTDGRAFDASGLAGQDVVLWFWAPWCTVCRLEAPQVLAAAEQVPEVAVVGVASSGPLADMQEFVAQTGTEGLTHVADTAGDVWQQFGVVSQPTFVFVDDDGRSQTFAGGLSQASLVDAMRQLEQA
jgi:thiol-disulfide isomerase/thioredoxin